MLEMIKSKLNTDVSRKGLHLVCTFGRLLPPTICSIIGVLVCTFGRLLPPTICSIIVVWAMVKTYVLTGPDSGKLLEFLQTFASIL